MIEPDRLLKDILHEARVVIAMSDDPVALELADRVNELNDHIIAGGELPSAWKSPKGS